MAAKITDVEEFLETLEPRQRQQVENLRGLILSLTPQPAEHIKWNSPSYVVGGIDRITINARNKERVVQVILHMDTARAEDRAAAPVMHDDTGLVRWLSDIRGTIRLAPDQAVEEAQAELKDVLTRWLEIRPAS